MASRTVLTKLLLLRNPFQRLCRQCTFAQASTVLQRDPGQQQLSTICMLHRRLARHFLH